MTHYSGYEDREHADDPINGPLTQDQLRDALRKQHAAVRRALSLRPPNQRP